MGVCYGAYQAYAFGSGACGFKPVVEDSGKDPVYPSVLESLDLIVRACLCFH